MQLEYNTIYSSKRKKLTITVERDRSVVVKAPTGTSAEQISRAIESRKLWIYEKINHSQKYQSPLHPPGKELVNGESLLFLGQSYQLEIVDTVDTVGTNDGIAFINNRFLFPKHLIQKPGAVFQDWYIQQAKEIILPRVQHYADRLGVSYNEAKITDSKYRWGSCTPQNNLTFNWRLIKAPMFVINYVVVHELTHLLEANHTPRFWGIINSQIAQMEKAKHWLKVHGALLDETL
jgi:predicted metal-dependent hydrolase